MPRMLVMHNLQLAARVFGHAAFMYLGKVIELGKTSELVANPQKNLTKDDLSGRYG